MPGPIDDTQNPLKPPTVITLPELTPDMKPAPGVSAYVNQLQQRSGAGVDPFRNPMMDPRDSATWAMANPLSPTPQTNTGYGSMLGYMGNVANAMGGISAIGTGRPNPVAPTHAGTPNIPPPTDARTLRINHAKSILDPIFGNGWTDRFTAQNGMDPISFYDRAVPAHITDPAERVSIAMNMAQNDAKYQPAELADWAQKHGNVPPPPEQWDTWWKMNQNGGPQYGGTGIDPYGVH